ncbi:glycine cleavage system aminomethyltransferase GcvT [Calycomorphotria hydatis]|nr:glycine cleavage system aminomethyltransferase GcvT [Calycomorphotria hydatis]
MLETALHAQHIALGGQMVDFAGWAMPIKYKSITEEHHAVRNGCGLFDISHMARLTFTGVDAVPFINSLVTIDVSKIRPGFVKYALVTNETGGVLDDILIYRLSDEHLMLVVNASNREKILGWIERHRGLFNFEWKDETFSSAMIALQGPGALAALEPLIEQFHAEDGATSISELKYYRVCSATLKLQGATRTAVISRTGYTGENGFEIILPNAYMEACWETLLAEGSSPQVTPCGLGCRDTLRLEAGMPLYGHELSETIDPLTAGLEFAVKFNNDEFIGKEPLRELAERGLERKRVGLELAGRRIARELTQVYAGDLKIGLVTSGTFSPTLEKSIAMAFVDARHAEPGTELTIDIRGKREQATVVPLPFYSRPK